MKWSNLATLALLITVAYGVGSCRPRSGNPSKAESSSSGGWGADKILEFNLSAGTTESRASSGFVPVPAKATFTGLVRALEKARQDQDKKGIFVRFGSASFNYAQAEELGRLFGELRQQGIPVVCHADGLVRENTWIAHRGCTRLWLSPAGDANLVGIAAQVMFMKDAMGKLDAKADFVHVGKYKSAPESLTRTEPSQAARESITGVLKSVRQSWLKSAKKSRKLGDVEKKLEFGPWSAKEAKKLSLVDELGYLSDALADIKKRANTKRIKTVYGPRSTPKGGPDMGELIRILAGGDDERTSRPHIAVVVAEGSISMQAGGILDGGGITAKALTKTLRKVAKDKSVKAVVLRVDSPGGSALASDLLWHELMEVRKKKPLIASVGYMAASGGYYLICAANKIVAERTSIVGSIGVFGGKIVLGGTMKKYGVNAATLARQRCPRLF